MKKFNFLFRISIVRVVILIMAITIISHVKIAAQRVFAPSEEGMLVELKENGTGGKFFGATKVNLPRKMYDVITEPFRIYIYSEMDIENEEFFVVQCGQFKQGVMFFPPIWRAKKKYYEVYKATLNRISPTIYEFTLPEKTFDPIDEDAIAKAKESGNFSASVKEIAIMYRPNKKHKKAGQKDLYWYANISQLPYESDDIAEWSKEQAIESVNELVEGGKTTQQLFASIKPQQTIQGNQVQYVIVQNTEQAIQQQGAQSNTQKDEKDILPESDVDKNIPYRDIDNEKTFAVIIANENYNKVAPVPFALKDGKKVNEYLKKTLGLDNNHIAYLEDATLNDMRYELKRLTKISEAYEGDCNFIIYYCGHGIPDEKNGNGYLLPVDGYGNDVSTAYSLSELYSYLGALQAKKVVLFTDACFSGAGKEGDMLVAARGIAIKANTNEPTGNLIAFSACQGDETAYSYKEKGHGLLTYFFLKKLQDTAGKVTLGELGEYIIDNVGKTAIVNNGKTQTPVISVSPSLQEDWRGYTLFE